MNALPEHRRVIAGRTWGRCWAPEDFAPITGPHSRNLIRRDRWLSVALACAAGVGIAFVLAAWWSS